MRWQLFLIFFLSFPLSALAEDENHRTSGDEEMPLAPTITIEERTQPINLLEQPRRNSGIAVPSVSPAVGNMAATAVPAYGWYGQSQIRREAIQEINDQLTFLKEDRDKLIQLQNDKGMPGYIKTWAKQTSDQISQWLQNPAAMIQNPEQVRETWIAVNKFYKSDKEKQPAYGESIEARLLSSDLGAFPEVLARITERLTAIRDSAGASGTKFYGLGQPIPLGEHHGELGQNWTGSVSPDGVAMRYQNGGDHVHAFFHATSESNINPGNVDILSATNTRFRVGQTTVDPSAQIPAHVTDTFHGGEWIPKEEGTTYWTGGPTNTYFRKGENLRRRLQAS
jgi:hypothetical protein